MDPSDFQLLLLRISHHPNRLALFLSEAALLLGIFLLRTWGLPRQSSWGKKIGFRLWTLLAYLLLAGFLAPRLWLGPDFTPLALAVVKSWRVF